MTKFICPRCNYETIIRITPNEDTAIYCPTCNIPMYVVWTSEKAKY